MSTHTESALVVSDWDETPTGQIEGGAALSRATAQTTFSGGLEGTGTSAWLLVYPTDGDPAFVGTQTFEGSLAGRTGTCVLRTDGSFDGGSIVVWWSVIPGSGTRELRGLSGSGGYRSTPDAPTAPATLDWSLG